MILYEKYEEKYYFLYNGQSPPGTNCWTQNDSFRDWKNTDEPLGLVCFGQQFQKKDYPFNDREEPYSKWKIWSRNNFN